MNAECPSCADFKILPAIEFHHYKKLCKEKYINLRDASKMNYNKEKIHLESQEGGGEIFCRNCHKAETSKLYKYFKEFINREDIFYDIEGEKRSAEEIIILIQKAIDKHLMTDEGKERSKKINRYKILVRKNNQ